MNKLALLLSVSGCLFATQADIIRTFDYDLAGDYDSDLDAINAYSYDDLAVSSSVPATTGFGHGNVFQLAYTLNGSYAAAGVGFAFPDWAPIDASTMTGIKIVARTTIVDSIKVTLKSSVDTAYDKLGLSGLSYDFIIEGAKAGVSTTLLPADFLLPDWWYSPAGTDAGKLAVQAWVYGTGAVPTTVKAKTAAMVAKRASVLSKLTGIQIAVGCETCSKVKGTLQIDSLIVGGINVAGDNWHDDITLTSGILTHGAKASAMHATVKGQMLTVALPSAGASSLELVRLDGTKVASWTVSGASASVALPAGLEKGAYFAVLTSAGQKSTASVSVLR